MRTTNKLFIPILLIVLILSVPLKAQDRTYCDTLIEKGIKAMWKKEYIKSIELLTQARDLAERRHWAKQQFKSILNIGSNHYAMLDYGEALNYYLEAYNVSIKNEMPKYEMLALNNIAILFSEEKNYNKARSYFEKAYKTARELKDYKNLGLYAGNLGNIGNQTNRLSEAREFLLEAIEHLKGTNEPQLLLYCKISLAENDYLRGNLSTARQNAQKLLQDEGKTDNMDAKISLQTLITKIYFKEKRYNDAENAAKALFKMNPDIEVQTEIFRLLSDIYSGTGDYIRALQFKDSVIASEKELNLIRNGKLFEANKAKLEIQEYKNQIAANQKTISLERTIFIALMAVVIAALVILLLIYKQRRAATDRKQRAVELDLATEKNEKLLLEVQVAEALLEQQHLQNEIETKNKKLSAKALFLSSRNELIEEIVDYLSKKPRFAKDPSLAEHLRSLKSHLRSGDDWDSFIGHFEEVNEGFLIRLRDHHPTLSANDIKFIAYIYMNISVKEIAYILNITLVAAKKRKERIISKMELSKDVDLYSYISRL